MDAAPSPAPAVAADPAGVGLSASTKQDRSGGWASRRGRAGSLIHSGVNVRGYYLMHALGATVPLAAGVALYGWRAAMCVAIIVASAAFALLIWRNIGPRGGQIQPAQALW